MPQFPAVVTSKLNFAADKSGGGKFSNFDPDARDAHFVGVDVAINNVRSLSRPPSLAAEGFVIAAHATPDPEWGDESWLEAVYVPSCLDLVKRLSGARTTLQMYYPIVRRRDAGAAPPATFIHLDQTREAYRSQAAERAAAAGVELTRGAIFNVWKAITPPPQDLPLAVCDRRTVSLNDYAIGVTVENGTETPYVALVHSSEAPTWYYVPDLTIDESIVFLSADFDPAQPLGCAHTAFSPPPVAGGYEPRASVEVRVLACFD
ncbi:MAG TPA: CmcJ/NvfI family oxidoreductase [Phenylobacterium sp.]|uniref:CmcJ/NvfI family oxidoreductase n=1 Tax=Phenylobacterium sp. TaxID=1871053 RepID=UPI002B4A848A|nr:CmcJ/NvfI family oxidoreductase [Phenylobacterium sp.]HKR87645.1 CmcJ/NvfI family oxidoreductase [Phenylobacterium sp.]